MGRLHVEHLHLETEPKCACKVCHNIFCYADLDVIRNDYQCQSGKALFATNVINIFEGKTTQKHFISGHYTIQDIYCINCFSIVGWKYITAQEEDNKFKEQNFVIEDIKVTIIQPSQKSLKFHGHIPPDKKLFNETEVKHFFTTQSRSRGQI